MELPKLSPSASRSFRTRTFASTVVPTKCPPGRSSRATLFSAVLARFSVLHE